MTRPSISTRRFPRITRSLALLALLVVPLVSTTAQAQPAQTQPAQTQPAASASPSPATSSTQSTPVSERPLRQFALTLGIGLPSLLHAELGLFVAPRILVELNVDSFVFNLLTGLRAELHVLGEGDQPRHALTIAVGAFVNPLIPMNTWTDPGAETVGVGGDILVGWRLLTDGGFLFRARAGAVMYAGSSGLETGPSLLISAGWAF